MLSALSVPTRPTSSAQLVDENWAVLEKVTGQDFIAFARDIGQLGDFAKFTDAEVWEGPEEAAGGRRARMPTPRT